LEIFERRSWVSCEIRHKLSQKSAFPPFSTDIFVDKFCLIGDYKLLLIKLGRILQYKPEQTEKNGKTGISDIGCHEMDALQVDNEVNFVSCSYIDRCTGPHAIHRQITFATL
jgi:hypothetical protein